MVFCSLIASIAVVGVGMVNKYELIQRAEALVPYEKHDDKYTAFYFMALRHVGMELKESIQAIRALLRKNTSEIKYTMIFFGGMEEVKELNIGHFIIGEAISMGLKPAILEMRRLMDAARSGSL